MPPLLTPADAQALTMPHHHRWLAAHRAGDKFWWTDFRKKFPLLFAAASPTTRAMLIHEVVCDHIRHSGAGGDITITDKLEFFAQIITGASGSILVRFKYLDSALQPHNHQSAQQDRLDFHDFTPEQLSLMGIPETPTVLTCGYQLAADQMSMSRVVVVCRWGSQYLWDYSVVSGRGAEILNLPGVEEPPKPVVRSRRVEEETTDQPE
jgi:hypothetical protein